MAVIRYQFRFPAPQTHYAQVEAHFPAPAQRELEVFLPVWTPGSYLIREYSRHLNVERATDANGRNLSVAKIAKNRWRVSSDEVMGEVSVHYSLYCHDLSARTNWVDENLLLLNGAAAYLNIGNNLAHEYEVLLDLPDCWKQSWSGLAGDRDHYKAENYDELIDCPIVAGDPGFHEFRVAGKPHFVLHFGQCSLWDGDRSARDVEAIVQQQMALWGELPYERYFFFNLLTGSGGAIEHRNSTVLLADRMAMRDRVSYLGWLDLVSHEFFHTWNVKRLRPVELGPFDYEHEVYSRNLWIAEGFTEYYGFLLTHRAGLSADDEFLGTNLPAARAGGPTSISGIVERLQNTPGRMMQPVAEASFDAWIKLYRPDENSINNTISYYVKGAVVAWLLDARIRRVTDGVRTLDDVMRLTYQRYSSERGFTSEEFIDACNEVASTGLKEWFRQHVDTTEELDYGEALEWFGLRFKPVPGDAVGRIWIGASTKVEAGRLTIKEVRRDGPGFPAGLSPGDEIIGIDGYRIRPEQWEERMTQYRPGETLLFTIARNDRLMTLPLPAEAEPPRRWLVEIDPNATEAQREHFRNW